MQSAGDVQRAIADAYRKKVGLLTGQEIRSLREAKELTQQQLADVMNVGIASIKRWETGMIQSKSMDHALRIQLQCTIRADITPATGKSACLGSSLSLKHLREHSGNGCSNPETSYYFWQNIYGTQTCSAFRQLGKGLTGASYAAMTYGPQLNNYKELVKSIQESDIKDAELLSQEELRVIHQVAEKFPNKRQVYDAAHRENIWLESKTGALIPYSCANKLPNFNQEVLQEFIEGTGRSLAKKLIAVPPFRAKTASLSINGMNRRSNSACLK